MPTRPKPPEGVATRDQILVWLSQAAETGHVGAMRLLLEEIRRDHGDTEASTDFIDELAQRRSASSE